MGGTASSCSAMLACPADVLHKAQVPQLGVDEQPQDAGPDLHGAGLPITGALPSG